MTTLEANEFRLLCEAAGVAVTHQRQVVYQVLKSMHGHPSPEEVNARPHHHLVCTECKSICDIDAEELGFGAQTQKLPGGFLAQRYAVDVLGLCVDCQKRLPLK